MNATVLFLVVAASIKQKHYKGLQAYVYI